jgi:acyl carrier protein
MENLKAEIAAIIAEVAEVPVEAVGEQTALSELGVDSLDALRIIAAIEKKYQMEVAEEQIGSVRTLSDIISLVAVSV